jgi:hypothetical protein
LIGFNDVFAQLSPFPRRHACQHDRDPERPTVRFRMDGGPRHQAEVHRSQRLVVTPDPLLNAANYACRSVMRIAAEITVWRASQNTLLSEENHVGGVKLSERIARVQNRQTGGDQICVVKGAMCRQDYGNVYP